MKKAIFIDKDNTLIPDVPYNVDPSLITLSEGAGQVLSRLKKQGYLLIVVSNQSGVAKGLFRESALEGVRNKLNELLHQTAAVKLDGFYYCPHDIQGQVSEYVKACECRKPKAGMIVSACQYHGIDPQESWMIGDIEADVLAGKTAGCKTILLRTYHSQEDVAQSRSDYSVKTWQEIGQIITER